MDSRNLDHFDQNCEMSHIVNQSISIDSSYDFKDLTVSNLADCTLKISATLSTLYASDLKNCTIISLPICTSIFVRNSKSCTFCVAGQQFRIHDSEKCDFYILVTSRAIVENCRDLRFAPYELKIEKSTYEKAGLNLRTNFWDKVNDFDWPSKNRPSPNWRVLTANERLEFSFSLYYMHAIQNIKSNVQTPYSSENGKQIRMKFKRDMLDISGYKNAEKNSATSSNDFFG
uniref:C-CAP/cofactor C-like domain-containing protein n=1 Tax=Romanomermis culicivorax TaxID=13658 RepID=A0A915HF08_ROMCU